MDQSSNSSALEAFKKIKSNVHGSLRYLIYKIESPNKLIVSLKGDKSSRYRDLIDVLPNTESRFVVYDYRYISHDNRKCDKLYLIHWFL
ncbi:hypothetical protein MHBO_004359 [Bonamia ostreae]|uniref:ADF-H domain-containing protein n=1 Tax=Bonamia ostreae TaxID=126728 RepID=A0ABV2AT38_9EUKA